jgi:hypothetical protein
MGLKRRTTMLGSMAEMSATMRGWTAALLVGLAAGLCAGMGTAAAETPAAAPAAAAQEGAPAQQDDVKQIKLTDEQVKRFIAAQADLATIASKIQAAGDTPDPALQTELEGIAKKHGFGTRATLSIPSKP